MVANQAVVVEVDAGVEDPACMTECLERDARLRPYCAEICEPVTAPNHTCARHCRDSIGESITEAQEAACDEECATIPTLGIEAMQLCVDTCTEPEPTGEGRDTMQCQESCDPDPYDYCAYIPCD